VRHKKVDYKKTDRIGQTKFLKAVKINHETYHVRDFLRVWGSFI
jgi:hypothetical protein